MIHGAPIVGNFIVDFAYDATIGAVQDTIGAVHQAFAVCLGSTKGSCGAQIARAAIGVGLLALPVGRIAQIGGRAGMAAFNALRVKRLGAGAARSCSFTGSTVVIMADGSKKEIEDIKVGDKVIATDPETGEQVAKTVDRVWVHEDTVTDLVVDGEVVTTTEDHPFWSVTDQRFERADELTGGEQVLGADGSVVTVSGLRVGTERDALAYNLTVEGIHTYHVGRSEMLVHNTCSVPLTSQVVGKTRPLTTAQAADLATYVGYARTNYLVKGERVFRRGGSYIVQDTTAHSGGVGRSRRRSRD